MNTAPRSDRTRYRFTRVLPTRGALLVLGLTLLVAACKGEHESTGPGTPVLNVVPVSLIIPKTKDSIPRGIVAENAAGGDGRWFDRWPADGDRLAIWASPYVLDGGDTLDLYVRANAPTVRLEIYRLGWYGGVGARLMHEERAIPAGEQVECTPRYPGPVVCPWDRSAQLVVPRGWEGGMYLAKVRDVVGRVWSYPFVIRSRGSHQLTGIVNQFTWQAYNKWGDASFYSSDTTSGAYFPDISFERPYRANAGMATIGGDWYAASYDLNAVRWLESRGYDIGYLSDYDLADSLRTLEPTKALVFLGHDEYWTWYEYKRAYAIRNAGTHLAFLSANVAYWNIRTGPGTLTGRRMHTLISYKHQTDPYASAPSQNTVRFRYPPISDPELQLLGVMYSVLLPGDPHPPMVVTPDTLRKAEANQFLAAGGLSTGDTLRIDTGTEGDEWFPKSPLTPKGTQVMLEMRYEEAGKAPRFFHSTFYRHASGAGVWATGTNRWAAYLDGLVDPVNPQVVGMTSSIIDWMISH